jgi:hypothetical protein
VQPEAVNVSDAELIDGLVAAGLPRGVSELLASFGAAIRGAQLDQLSAHVQDLTGHVPSPSRQPRSRADTPQRGTGSRVRRRRLSGSPIRPVAAWDIWPKFPIRPTAAGGSGREQLLGTDVVEQAHRPRGAS